MAGSIIDELARLPEDEKHAYLESLTEDELELLISRDWSVTGRPDQFLPHTRDTTGMSELEVAELAAWFLWLIRAGRGWGKTRTGAEGTKESILEIAAVVDVVRWALVAPRREDVRAIQFEGESGLQAILPPSMLLRGSWDLSFNKTDLLLTLANGAQVKGYHGRDPGQLRGPQHHGAWVDEPGTLPDAHLGLDDDTTMSMLLLGLRLPPHPRLIVTGTPRNNRLWKELRKMPGAIETHGRTRDNLANLAHAFKVNVVQRYAGTRLGRQELDAEVLEGVGALFQRGWFKVEQRPPWPENTATRSTRYWDLASGEESDANTDPDWTAGALVEMDPRRRLYWIADIARFRESPGQREMSMRTTALEDRLSVTWIEKEPGNAGKAQLFMVGRELEQVGVSVKGMPVSGPKAVKWELVATAAAQGRVWMKEADWNLAFLDEAEEAHPDPLLSGPHDDQLDAVAGAFIVLRESKGAGTILDPSQMQLDRPAVASASRGSGRTPDLPRPGARHTLR